MFHLVAALCALLPAAAAAEPGSGPRETIDQRFTTTQPGAPSGLEWSGRYHAADDPNGDPPFMERMVFYPPAGMRYDTSVPKRCTASDLELSLNGPAACPKGSRLGGGTTEGVLTAPVADDVEFERYSLPIHVMNNTNEQILLVESPQGYTVVRGQMRADGSIAFASPTCFPAPPTGECLDDNALQTGSSSSIPEYTRTAGGAVRSYATTPPTCPASGHWTSVVAFWWKDGSFDEVATTQPCTTA